MYESIGFGMDRGRLGPFPADNYPTQQYRQDAISYSTIHARSLTHFSRSISLEALGAPITGPALYKCTRVESTTYNPSASRRFHVCAQHRLTTIRRHLIDMASYLVRLCVAGFVGFASALSSCPGLSVSHDGTPAGQFKNVSGGEH